MSRRSHSHTLREQAPFCRTGTDVSPSPWQGERRGGEHPLTFLDLFCGCGGFSLGMRRAGWHELAAIDFSPQAVATFHENFPHGVYALERDLTTFKPDQLDHLLSGGMHDSGRPRVDVIVGGPPCQGFSNARRRDGSNHGEHLKHDSRRELYQEFLAYVAYFHPRVFVMENVLGIRTAAGGEFFTRVQSEARALGYRVHGEEICAWHYGVPQKRIRQLIVGTRRELPLFSAARLMPPTHAAPGEDALDGLEPVTTLWEAIGDLPPLDAGNGTDEMACDLRRRQSLLARYGGRYLKKVLEAHRAKRLTGHVARPHSDRDLRDFALLHEGESSAVAMRERFVEFEWPYSKEHFKDRYTRQHRHRLCSTIVAHLSKDGLMFIHPTQNRSLTPREAARIQSFPDWFQFPAARTHSFRLIGNAVPPLVGEAVGRAIRRYLAEAQRNLRRTTHTVLPRDEREALVWLQPLVEALKHDTLPLVLNSEFKRGWLAAGFLCYGLHPDAAAESGVQVGLPSADLAVLNRVAPHLASPVFVQSGWPVALVPIALEAQRRFQRGTLRSSDYYCSDAHTTGARRFDTGRF
jgi:DNA (cytosine-5)-methyltransferase 1